MAAIQQRKVRLVLFPVSPSGEGREWPCRFSVVRLVRYSFALLCLSPVKLITKGAYIHSWIWNGSATRRKPKRRASSRKKMKPTGSNWRCVLLEELSPRQTSELNLAREQAIRAAAEREVSSLKAEQDVLNLKLRLGAEKGMDAVNLKVS